MIISPFNYGFFILLFIGVAAIFGIYFCFRNKDEKVKTKFMLIFCLSNLVLYFVYKIMLGFDTEYIMLSGRDIPAWYDVLPLHLCNINLFLIPIGIFKKNNYLLGFSFFVAPLAAIMPFIFPEPEFMGFSIFLPRMFGYYVTHLLIIISAVSIGTLGFYKPVLKSLPKVVMTLLALSISVHGINTLIRLTLYSRSNYFFTYETGGVSALDFFWSLIPIPYIYELPTIFILIPYMLLICEIYKLMMRKKQLTV